MRPALRSCLAAALVCLGTIEAHAVADDRGKPAAAPAPAPLAIEATALSGAIQIDGVFNEDAWSKAPVVDQFVQRDPKEGVPATHHTEVRVVYDATALYVAVRADEPEPSISHSLTLQSLVNS